MHRGWSLSQDIKRRQLTLLTFLWFAGAVLASVVIMIETNEVFDNAMSEAANAVVAIAPDPAHISNEARDRIEKVALSGDRRKYMTFQIRDARGNVLFRSSQAPEAAYPAPLVAGYSGSGEMRYLTRELPGGGTFVQIAEFYDERRDLFLGLLAGFSIPLLALIALGAALLTRSVNRLVAPITRLGGELEKRSGSNMSTIDGLDLPVELEPIVTDTNRLLDRLKRALDSERAFSANCAHELRNPIASAKAHAEFVRMFPNDPTNVDRLTSLDASLGQLSHRIERLLHLSRAEAGGSVNSQASDLIEISQILVEDYLRRGHKIDFREGPSPRLAVAIDKDALGIAIQNLIDNALAHTAAHTPVEVRICLPGQLHVVNDCAVVDPTDLGRLKERFARDRNSRTAGFGLGLAIVGELMRQVGGSLELKSPADGRSSGFEAIMSLPPA